MCLGAGLSTAAGVPGLGGGGGEEGTVLFTCPGPGGGGRRLEKTCPNPGFGLGVGWAP